MELFKKKITKKILKLSLLVVMVLVVVILNVAEQEVELSAFVYGVQDISQANSRQGVEWFWRHVHYLYSQPHIRKYDGLLSGSGT